MRDLDYQRRTLSVLDAHLAELAVAKRKVDAAAKAMRDAGVDMPVPDFTKTAWDALAPRRPAAYAGTAHSARVDGLNRPVPNATLKIPTGGGKTYLATAAVSRILGAYLGRNTGFVLWIVPNDAIYAQTKKSLSNREHPYRQALERAAAGRVKILEKDDRLDARDAENNLCVMLLMLQSANRESKDSLRMFKDRGNVSNFFPPESEGEKHQALLKEIPNLDAYNNGAGFWPMVKDSLGNALRLIRPVVVMDEGHKALSDLAMDTLYGFNPCFVLELSATPKDKKRKDGSVVHANVLVEVTGSELDREGMIKMPMNVAVRAGDDWKACLRTAVSKIKELQASAEKLTAEQDRRIRPILLVQVERTGKDQLDSNHIHAEHAREALLQLGFDAAEIAVKSAETNEIENMDLLAATCPVRAIITKSALQEGWDCPFAYVLCALAASTNLSNMTQLAGRILRQPHAEKTGVAALDECYVFCHHAKTQEVLDAIKQGLEEDGLGDLVRSVVAGGDAGTGKALVPRKIARRDKFQKAKIFLPKVLWVDGGIPRELDYEQDVLSGLDWSAIHPAALAKAMPLDQHAAETQFSRIRVQSGAEHPLISESIRHATEAQSFDPVYAARMLGEVVPNPWIARQLVADFVAALKKRGFDDAKLGTMAGFLADELRKWAEKERDRMAEAYFKAQVGAERIQFRLRADAHNWAMPTEWTVGEPASPRQLAQNNGAPLDKSLFMPVFEADFNDQEKEVAVYLDEEKALHWWHRNVARHQYFVQGWRKDKVYPDFIFALNGGRLVAMETKGDHLGGNLDTEYKRKLLDLASTAFRRESIALAGKMEVVEKDGSAFTASLVLMEEWKRKLPDLVRG